MPLNLPILYLAPVEWNSIWQRPQQIARILSQKYPLVYVDPVGLRSLSRQDIPRIWNRLTSAPCSLYFGKETPVKKFIRPVYVPFLGNSWTEKINRAWLLRQMRKQFPPADTGRFILWISAPSLLADMLLETTRPQSVIYDVMDKYEAFHHSEDAARIRATETKILRRAQVIFTSSQSLLGEYRTKHPRVELVSNGVDLDTFRIKALNQVPNCRKEMQKTEGPIIGYYGTIDRWLDFELIRAIAKKRPDWNMVLIGPWKCAQGKEILSEPNIVWLGPRPYEHLPSYAGQFDAALIPFKTDEITRRVNPIKFYEYMALGLPVIASPLPELKSYEKLLHFADTTEKFIGAIELNLRTGQSPVKAETRAQFAKFHSWKNGVKPVLKFLEEVSPKTPPDASESIAAIVVNWKDYPATERCVASLDKSDYKNLRICIVDNGSKDGSAEKLKKRFPNHTILKLEEDKGYAAGLNAGIRWAMDQDISHLLLLSNDLTADPMMVTELHHALSENEKIGAVAPKIYYQDDPERLWWAGSELALRWGIIRIRGYKKTDEGQYDLSLDSDYLAGCCILVKKEAVSKAGLWDESYFHTGEDVDFGIRLRRAGYKLLMVPTAKLYHKVALSSDGDLSPTYLYYLERNRIRLMKKFGYWRGGISLLLITPIFLKRVLAGLIKAQSLPSVKAVIRGFWDGIRQPLTPLPKKSANDT